MSKPMGRRLTFGSGDFGQKRVPIMGSFQAFR